MIREGIVSIFTLMSSRRSIRKFLATPVSAEVIESLITAASLAPSGKNRQPWHFTVLQGDNKEQLVDLLESGVQALKERGQATGSAESTAKVMRQAPVCIVIHNPHFSPDEDHNGVNRYRSLVDTQSIGAAIQNMLLMAEELGLGTLWICDVFYAETAINVFLGRSDELVAAIALGYPDEAPSARPRKTLDQVTTWFA